MHDVGSPPFLQSGQYHLRLGTLFNRGHDKWNHSVLHPYDRMLSYDHSLAVCNNKKMIH